MSAHSRYTSDGKRKSSQTHARRVRVCPCGRECRGNGGWSSHKKACRARRVATLQDVAVTPERNGR